MFSNRLEELAAYIDDGMLDKAEKLLAELKSDSRRMRPEQKADYHYYTGMYHSAKGEWEEAELALRKLNKDGFRKDEVYNRTRSLHAMGQMSCKQGKHDEGIKYYRQALRVWNAHENNYFLGLAQNYLGQGYCMQGKEDNEGALIYYYLAENYALTARDGALALKCALATAQIAKYKDAGKALIEAWQLLNELDMPEDAQICMDKINELKSNT